MLKRFAAYLQTQNIQANIQNNQYNSRNRLYLNNSNIRNTIIQSRDILYNNLNNNNLKFAEKISFRQGGNYVVAIGYNPALNLANKIDKTNNLLAEYFNSLKYDGYYLFNMLPDVSGTKVPKKNSSYPDYIENVLDFLIQDSSTCNCDIFIFWGSSVYLNNDVICKLNKIKTNCSRGINTIGTKNICHRHPGRVVGANQIWSFAVNLNQLMKGVHYLK